MIKFDKEFNNELSINNNVSNIVITNNITLKGKDIPFKVEINTSDVENSELLMSVANSTFNKNIVIK